MEPGVHQEIQVLIDIEVGKDGQTFVHAQIAEQAVNDADGAGFDRHVDGAAS